MFLRFASTTDRDEFIEKAKRREPRMLSRIRVSKTQPEVVTIRSTTPGEARTLADIAGDKAEVYDDIEFKTF